MENGISLEILGNPTYYNANIPDDIISEDHAIKHSHGAHHPTIINQNTRFISGPPLSSLLNKGIQKDPLSLPHPLDSKVASIFLESNDKLKYGTDWEYWSRLIIFGICITIFLILIYMCFQNRRKRTKKRKTNNFGYKIS